MADKLKQSLYFPEDTLREMVKEANRLDRSLSWTVQQAWRLAREEVKKFPPVHRAGGADVRPAGAAAHERLAAAVPRADADASAQVREFLRGKFDRELTN